MEVRVFRRVEVDPGTNVQIIAAAESIGAPVFWRILHEQSGSPYDIHREQDLTPPGHRARVTNGFSHNVL
jgi:hypothetical protein